MSSPDSAPSTHPMQARREQIAYALCFLMSLFHMYTAGIGLVQTPIQRSVHLGFALSIVFLLFPFSRDKKWNWVDWPLLLGGVTGTAYIALFCNDIALRGGKALPHEIVLGCMTILIVLEAGRRVLGKALPCIGIIFLLYCYMGSWAPSIFVHRGYSLARIIQHMYLTSEGLFGVALGVSSTYIFMFILFGTFLARGGGVRLFNNLAYGVAGNMTGGPAKIAVISSGLMGTINGSSVANAATVGTFTIPTMVRTGYSREDAAAIEACASTGGQIMPPIMGAGAFIMAEFLNIPYYTVALAAILPACLYYVAIFLNIHFMAKRYNLQGVDTAKQKVSAVLRADGLLLLPLLLIIVMLILHYTPLKSAFWAIAAIYFICLLKKDTRFSGRDIADTFAAGAKGAVGTAVACAMVGFIVGGCSLTALGLTLSENILDLSQGSLFLTLFMSMVACLVLGIGLPTTANYIVTSTIVVPALIKLGVPGLAAHMFVFYFGIMADLTPPVAMAVFTASGIAGADHTKAGLKAAAIAIPSYFAPYMFVYAPSLLFVGGTTQEAILTFCCAIIGIVGICTCMQKWLFTEVSLPFRLLAFGGGLLCYFPENHFKLIGIGIIVAIVALYFVKNRMARAAAPSVATQHGGQHDDRIRR